MPELFEKSMNLGLGLLVYSREKIESFVEDMVARGQVARQDARQFAADLVKSGQQQREELNGIIRREVSSTLDRVGIARKEEALSREDIAQIVREVLAEREKAEQQSPDGE